MRTILLILIAVVVLGAALFLFGMNDQVPADDMNDQDQVEQTPDGDQVTSMQTYQGTVEGNLSFTLQYPDRAVVSQVQENIYEIKYVGPNSEPNTEITDGYYASMIFTEAADLEEYARSQDPTSNLQSLTFSGHEALTFTTESELGNEPTEHLVYRVGPEDQWVVDMSYRVSGDQAVAYREELLDTLRTLQVSATAAMSDETMTLDIAMLDYDQQGQESDGPERGCDRLVFIEETIPATTTPLNASLRTLFSYDSTTVEGWNNFIANTNDTLMFEEATLTNGTASVYLSGELSGLAGVCDNPRARIQIEETALQFDTVDEVIIYLNGEETELQPSGRGE